MRPRKDFLRAEVATTRALLESLDPRTHYVDRIGLKARLEDLSQQLLVAEAEPVPVGATLTFGGAPVAGQQGIEATFASGAVAAFQDLVARVGASQRHGGLSAGGPIPEADAFRFHITDVARGSFGFELAQVAADGADSRELADAVNDAGGLLRALAADEETFLDSLGEVDERVFKALREFVERVAKGGATLKLVSGDVSLAMSHDDMRVASERVTSVTQEQGEIELTGTLLGILPDSGQFEFRQAATVIHGRIWGMADPQLLGLVQHDVIAKFWKTVTRRPGKPPKETYVLAAARPTGPAPTATSNDE